MQKKRVPQYVIEELFYSDVFSIIFQYEYEHLQQQQLLEYPIVG